MQNPVRRFKPLANMVMIQIDDEDNAFSDYVRRYIKKKFAYALFLDRSVIIYAREEDRAVREFFLSRLAHAHDKDKSKPTQFHTHLDVPLYIEFVRESDAPSRYFAMVKTVGDDKVCFTLKRDDTKEALWKLAEIFKEALFSLEVPQNKITVKIDTQRLLDKTVQLIGQGVIFGGGQEIQPIYNNEEIAAFCEKLKNRLNSRHRVFLGYDKNSHTTMRTLLATLECTDADSFESVRQSYRKLIKRYHPDNVFGADEGTVQSYSKRFRSIQEAYENIRFMMAS